MHGQKNIKIRESRLLWGMFLKLLLNFGKNRKAIENTSSIILFD